MQAQTKFLSSRSKINSILFSCSNVVPSNPCLGLSPTIKMSFFLLSSCTEELISTPKIITLQPKPTLGNQKVPLPSNPIPCPEYLYLSMSPFLFNLTAPNKQFSKVV